MRRQNGTLTCAGAKLRKNPFAELKNKQHFHFGNTEISELVFFRFGLLEMTVKNSSAKIITKGKEKFKGSPYLKRESRQGSWAAR